MDRGPAAGAAAALLPPARHRRIWQPKSCSPGSGNDRPPRRHHNRRVWARAANRGPGPEHCNRPAPAAVARHGGSQRTSSAGLCCRPACRRPRAELAGTAWTSRPVLSLAAPPTRSLTRCAASGSAADRRSSLASARCAYATANVQIPTTTTIATTFSQIAEVIHISLHLPPAPRTGRSLPDCMSLTSPSIRIADETTMSSACEAFTFSRPRGDVCRPLPDGTTSEGRDFNWPPVPTATCGQGGRPRPNRRNNTEGRQRLAIEPSAVGNWHSLG